MEEIFKWLVIVSVVWPILLITWELILFPAIKWSVIDVGRKGFVPLLINLAGLDTILRTQRHVKM